MPAYESLANLIPDDLCPIRVGYKDGVDVGVVDLVAFNRNVPILGVVSNPFNS
jgi:hypothetical protein